MLAIFFLIGVLVGFVPTSSVKADLFDEWVRAYPGYQGSTIDAAFPISVTAFITESIPVQVYPANYTHDPEAIYTLDQVLNISGATWDDLLTAGGWFEPTTNYYYHDEDRIVHEGCCWSRYRCIRPPGWCISNDKTRHQWYRVRVKCWDSGSGGHHCRDESSFKWGVYWCEEEYCSG